MTPNKQIDPGGDVSAGEETLRLIAKLPAPDGLENRVKAKLAAAPRSGRLLRWPGADSGGGLWMRSAAARTAAAAAIVFVVAGAGWGVYSRVQPVESQKVIVMPPRVNTTGGFSNAGAMRTPQTLDGPVLAHPVADVQKQNDDGVKAAPSLKKKPRHAKTGSAENAAAQPVTR